jgi:hypothetical protein
MAAMMRRCTPLPLLFLGFDRRAMDTAEAEADHVISSERQARFDYMAEARHLREGRGLVRGADELLG